MRRVGRTLLCLAVAGAFAAAAAASASAQPPEYGRCVAKAVVGGSGFKTSKCTSAAGTGAKYEWLPGPGPQPGFSSEAKIVYSHGYKICRTALFEEELAKRERAEAETAPEPLKAELIEKAVEHETSAADTYRRAEKDRKECEALIESEEGKAPVRLATADRAHLSCAAESSTGDYAGPTEVADVRVTLSECAKKEQSCQTEGAGEGEIVTSQLSGRLGVISVNKGKIKPGLDLQPEADAPFVEFSCGSTSFVITGSLVRSVLANQMTKVEARSFHQKHGHQKPEGFLGEPDYLEAALDGAAAEPIGVEIRDEQVSEEKIEVSTTL